MERFQFRLERVLVWQQKLCRVAEEKVRQATLAVSQIEDEMVALKTASVTAEAEFMTLRAPGVVDLQALARFRRKVVQCERVLQQKLQECLEALAAEKKKLQAERHRLRLIEKLRERDWREFTIETDRAMETLASECFLAKWVTKVPTGPR